MTVLPFNLKHQQVVWVELIILVVCLAVGEHPRGHVFPGMFAGYEGDTGYIYIVYSTSVSSRN